MPRRTSSLNPNRDGAHLLPMPDWQIGLRVLQALLAVALLGLCGYYAITPPHGLDGVFIISTTTIFICIYILSAYFGCPQMLNYPTSLAFDLLLVILWTGNLISAASVLDKFPLPEESTEYEARIRGYVILVVIVAINTIEIVLAIILLAFTILYITRHQTERNYPGASAKRLSNVPHGLRAQQVFREPTPMAMSNGFSLQPQARSPITGQAQATEV